MNFSTSLDRKLVTLILILCIPLLFLPKINLITVNGESAGLRIDDFILLLATGLLLFARLAVNNPLLKAEKTLITFVSLSLLSIFFGWTFYLAGNLTSPPRLIYLLRLIEYFTFFYIGLICYRVFDPMKILVAWFATNVIVMLLQWKGLLGGFTINGYVDTNSLDGPPGITNGHWEIGFLIGILYAVFAFSISSKPFFLKFKDKQFISRGGFSHSLVQVGLFFTMLFLAIITTSRSGLLGVFAVGILIAMRSMTLPKRFFVLFLGALVCSTFLYFVFPFDTFKDFGIVWRSANLFSWRNFDIIKEIYANINVTTMTDDAMYSQIDLTSKNVDVSWLWRIHKWGFVIKYMVIHPECYVLGLGPGFCGSALDGGLLRLFIENGLLGGVTYLALLYGFSQRDDRLKACVIVLLINMIFLDTYFAYKGMSIFFSRWGLFTECPAKKSISMTLLWIHRSFR